MEMKFGNSLSFVLSEKMGREETGLGGPQRGPTWTLIRAPGALAV